jgi:hypothetical protein
LRGLAAESPPLEESRIEVPDKQNSSVTFPNCPSRRWWYAGCLLLLMALPAVAHVGSPDVFYEGDAGPYHLFVTVRVPQVVPGVAEVEVRSQLNDVTQVRIMALGLTGAGAKYPPSPETTERSKQDPQFFTGNIWLMEFGSLQVRVQVDGTRGKGEISVPVPAISQQALRMDRPLAGVLFGLTMLLAFAAVAIAVAAAREGELVPGTKPVESDRRRGRIVLAVASLLCFALLYGGRRWWDAEEAVANANIYQVPQVSATLESGDRLLLSLQATKEQDRELPRGWTNPGYLADLIPDHNHLMHLFLIRLPQMDRFLHLHPDRTGDQFVVQLPNLPAGRYQIFADVVHQTGFPTTLVGEVELHDVTGRPTGGDDSEWAGAAILSGANATSRCSLPDGGQMVWERPASPLKAGKLTAFRFRVEDAEGKPVQDLEPYMGMAAHAEFVRSDLTVFAHVHPAGSAPMAALELAQAGLLAYGGPAQNAMASDMAMSPAALSPEVSFPYGFPKPGDYRLFIQVKRAGRVETGVFDAHVE